MHCHWPDGEDSGSGKSGGRVHRLEHLASRDFSSASSSKIDGGIEVEDGFFGRNGILDS